MVVLLSAENNALLQRTAKRGVGAVEAIICGVLPTLSFCLVYWLGGFQPRYDSVSALFLGPILFGVVAIVLALFAYFMFKSARPCRFWICLAVCMSVSVVLAWFFADYTYWTYSAPYYTYEEMAQYSDIDPAVDKGGSYMDAGEIYFRESSYVATNRAMAFHNGDTYCVAPVLRVPLLNQDGSGQLQTYSGWVMPPAGSVDFWAVGINCCGDNGNSFNCGAVGSHIARSGLRLVNDRQRPMFLLAVQEWVATTGLPVRHPLFFTWTEDPIKAREDMLEEAWRRYWLTCAIYFIGNLFLAFFCLAFLQKMRVY